MKRFARADLVFLSATVLFHAVSLALTLHYQRFFNGDSFEYITEAFNIKEHLFFYSGNPALPITEEYMTLRTPGYPLFLALIYSFVVSSKAVVLVQHLVSVFNIWYLRKTIRIFGYEERYDWLLLLLIISFPVQFTYAGTIAPDLMLQTTVLVYFRHAVLWLRTREAKQALYMSLALAAGLFMKPVLYPFAAIHLLMVVLYALYHHVSLKRLVLPALLPLLCILGYNSWNYGRTGKFHFTSIQSFNALYYYHHYYGDREGTARAKEFLEAERSVMRQLPSFRQRYDYAHHRGTALLAEHSGDYLQYHLRKAATFFFEAGKGEMDLFSGRMTLGSLYAGTDTSLRQVLATRDSSRIFSYARAYPSSVIAALVLVFNLLRLLGLVLMLRSGATPGIVKWFVFLFLVYFALITGPISNAHYLLPVSLILAGCAACGYAGLLHKEMKMSIITV